MNTSWSISRRLPACTACQRDFVEGERHHSALSVREEALVREDLCRSCWDARREEGGPEPIFWWRTRHSVGRKRGLQLDLDALEALFRSLEGRAERGVRELRYVLCLLLMRKRRLKVLAVERGEEGESFVVRRPRREERMRVFVFDFTPERMGELRAELSAILEGLEDPEDPEEAEEPAAGEPPPAEEADAARPSAP